MATPLALVALVPAAAHAGVGSSAVPTFPPVVTVGESGIAASIELRNTNTGVNVGDVNTVCNFGDPLPCPAGARGVALIPSCAVLGADVACTSADPGVFAISPTATGAPGTSCANTTFDVVASDAATGLVRFTPRATHVTLPGTGSTCTIRFTFAVLKSPTLDYDPAVPGIQTLQLAENVQHNGSLPSFERGTSAGVTVLRARPGITTAASGTVPVGGQLTDTATVTGLVNPVPGATVDFRLYGPDDEACSGPPVFESLAKPVAADGTAVSDPFTPTAPGVYRWRAFYSGDANNEPVAGNCNDGGENVTVTAAPPTVTVQDTGDECVKTAFNLRIAVAATGLKGVRVKLDGRTIKTSKKAKFTLRVRALGLARGPHTLKIVATGAGGRAVEHVTFFRCRKPPVPRFVG